MCYHAQSLNNANLIKGRDPSVAKARLVVLK